MLLSNDTIGRTHWNDPLSPAHLAISLASLPLRKNIDLVCVGTDRSTGDALGPLIGTNLQRRQEEGFVQAEVKIYGTIHHPVHALNLEDVIESIEKNARDSTVIAIDACLGKVKNIGFISVKQGPLLPGTGVNKRLPALGDYHIVGVVNVAGFMEHVVLQNTRLSLVIQMADVITEALVMCFGARVSKAEAALGAT